MPDNNTLPLSQQDMTDLNEIKSKLPGDHPMRAKIDQTLSMNSGEMQTKPGGPVTQAPAHEEPLQPDEAEASGMQTIMKEHPGIVAGAAAAGAAPALAAEGVPTAIGEGIQQGVMRIPPAYYGYKKGQSIGKDIGGEPGEVIGGVAGAGLGFFAPELLKKTIGRYLPPVPIKMESPTPAPHQEPGVIQAPEPREPTVGERPGSQFSVPREQLPANVKSGQPGAGEAYRSIGGKVIYTPPTGSEEPYHPPGIDQEPSQPTVGNGIKSNARADLLKPAENRPEWVQQQHEYEINRLKGILRNDKATPEERSIAQSQLDNMRGTNGQR